MERLLAEPSSLIETLWQFERDAQPLATPEAKAGLKAGDRYKFELKDPAGNRLPHKSDPVGFYCEQYPSFASVVYDHGQYQWQDADWRESQLNDKREQPLSIYELHVGSWRRKPEDKNRPLTYRELAEELPAYVKDLGFTHVEFMPVMHHPFNGSWGYQTLGLHAPTSRHGPPEGFARFVRACHAQGAELAFSYVGERFKERITEFARDFGSELIFDCDVGDDAQIDKLFADLSQVWPQFDGFVHSIGFAPREAIAGDFLDGLTRENFRIAHDISAYSFPAMAKAALPYLNPQSALLTLTYLGAIRVVPNYNTMGLAKASLEASVRYLADSLGPKDIRVNGISAGPIKTLAASGIKGFGKILSVVAEASPIRRNVTIDDVGNVAAFLLSDLAGGVTAEITYVDGGYSHTTGVSRDSEALS